MASALRKNSILLYHQCSYLCCLPRSGRKLECITTTASFVVGFDGHRFPPKAAFPDLVRQRFTTRPANSLCFPNTTFFPNQRLSSATFTWRPSPAGRTSSVASRSATPRCPSEQVTCSASAWAWMSARTGKTLRMSPLPHRRRCPMKAKLRAQSDRCHRRG